jgi:hypothetical protein
LAVVKIPEMRLVGKGALMTAVFSMKFVTFWNINFASCVPGYEPPFRDSAVGSFVPGTPQ